MRDRSAAGGDTYVRPVYTGKEAASSVQPYRQEYFLGRVIKDIPWVSQVRIVWPYNQLNDAGTRCVSVPGFFSLATPVWDR